MLIATFGPSTGWAGKTITYDEGVFTLEGHGVISPADVLTYDRQGHISWGHEGLREWVQQLATPSAVAAAPQVQPVGVAPPLTSGGPPVNVARSHKARNIVLGIAGALAVLVLIAVAVGSQGGQSASKTESTPVATATTPAPGDVGSSVGVVGDDCIYTDDSGARAVVTLISVTDHAQAKDTTIGEPPENGAYVVCDISIEVTAGTYDFNPLYFYYQSPDGHTYDPFEGNGMSAGFDPWLNSGTLSAGQHTRGFVTFDVPNGESGADIQLTDPMGGVVFQWNR